MMQAVSRVLLGVCFALFLFGADFPTVPHAGTQADPYLVYATDTASVCFDDIYTAQDVSVVRVDIEVLSETDVLVDTWTFTSGWSISNGLFRCPFRPQAVALANGMYKLRARVWDSYGTASEYSDAVWAKKRWVALNRPGGCKTLP